MTIAQVNKNYFGTTKEKELKKKVSEFVKNNLVGKKITFSKDKNGIDLTIELTWQGLKNDINEVHPPYAEKLISFAVLDKILKQAKFLRKEKGKRGYNVVVYRFYSQIKIDNTIFDVIFIIKKTSKTYLYEHILLYIKI